MKTVMLLRRGGNVYATKFFSHFLITSCISLDIKCQQMDIVVQYLELCHPESALWLHLKLKLKRISFLKIGYLYLTSLLIPMFSSSFLDVSLS